jgi:nucleoside-diphosphate-sugar epimerase
MLDERVGRAVARSGKRIVITGAGGWLGLATLDALVHALGSEFATRVVAFGSSARTLQLRDGTLVEQRPLAELCDLVPVPTWVLHFAFLTKDRAETMDEAAYRRANAGIRDTVLAALDGIGAEGVFVASSGAAYKAQDATAPPAMRLYGELKIQDEEAFAAWGERSGFRTVIARIFNLTGPYINKHQAYALASFILDAVAGRPIEVRAAKRVVRGYVAIDELMALVFAELAAEPSGIVRLDSGGEPLELGDVAQVVADQFTGIAVKRAAITDAAADLYHGDGEAYRRSLAKRGLTALPLAEQVAKTIDYLGGAQ